MSPNRFKRLSTHATHTNATREEKKLPLRVDPQSKSETSKIAPLLNVAPYTLQEKTIHRLICKSICKFKIIKIYCIASIPESPSVFIARIRLWVCGSAIIIIVIAFTIIITIIFTFNYFFYYYYYKYYYYSYY